VRAIVQVRLKQGVLDPQGKAIEAALSSLGFDGVGSVRQGKLIEIELAASDPESAREEVGRMADALLANPVIETWTVELAGE
jgi:phosphoribosylformylglycinamidine synthase subunit PurS